MAIITDGGGIYRQDAILGPFDKGKVSRKVFVPHIEEIRAILGEDGETYYNAKDLAIAMKQIAFSMPLPTLSVFEFIKQLTFELITARR